MKSLTRRFREIDKIGTPFDQWASPADDGGAAGSGTSGRASGRPRRFLAAGISAIVVLGAAFTLMFSFSGAPDISWISSVQGSCVEHYSIESLARRSWAFEGVIVDVRPPKNPESSDPIDLTTTIMFDVKHWYWGGSDKEVAFKVYSTRSSAGEIDDSEGAGLLVSGEEDFLWLCGFTQGTSPEARADFAEAASLRSTGS